MYHAHRCKSRQELLRGSDVEWAAASAADAQRHLHVKGFLKNEVSVGIQMAGIAVVLLRIAAAADSVVTADACRAVAILLEQRKVNVTINVLTHDVSAIRALMEEPVGRDGTDGDGAPEQCRELETLTERLGEGITGMIDRVEAAPETYARVVGTATCAPPRHTAAVASTSAWARQIMVDCSPMVDAYTLMTLNKKELVMKANLALASMARELSDDTAPARTVFVGANKLRSGAVFLHLTSAAAADWVRIPKRMGAFLAGMGGTSIYKPWLFSVVVEFVPVSFDPALEHVFTTIEDAYGIGCRELVQVHFIKPPERRHVAQRSAHTIFGFVHVMDRWHVMARKLLSEPVQCFKCQIIGGGTVRRRACPWHDVCAHCGDMHRTVVCKVHDEERVCSNCRAAKRPFCGHGAADRSYPAFENKLQFALERNSEANYRFFPMDDPATWEDVRGPVADLNNQDALWQDGGERGKAGVAVSSGGSQVAHGGRHAGCGMDERATHAANDTA
ncbi:hypothetical protein B0H17DRAFT_1217940 [Mycena rosella]|uniref:Uncharacterized protein n=1 Tax=Mycena rosella TaxID=1033263 RepID=A0AAD7FNK4_MYCRO|nr:hypothetical protein B0H17DRAFT_1217940 [Mycena rosella]